MSRRDALISGLGMKCVRRHGCATALRGPSAEFDLEQVKPFLTPLSFPCDAMMRGLLGRRGRMNSGAFPLLFPARPRFRWPRHDWLALLVVMLMSADALLGGGMGSPCAHSGIAHRLTMAAGGTTLHAAVDIDCVRSASGEKGHDAPQDTEGTCSMVVSCCPFCAPLEIDAPMALPRAERPLARPDFASRPGHVSPLWKPPKPDVIA